MTVMTEKEREILAKDVDKLMESFVKQAQLLGKKLFVCPLSKIDFRWLISNPDKGVIGITGICPSASVNADEKFCCIIVNSKRALYYQDEGFTFTQILDCPDALKVVPAKDILSKIL